MARARAALVLVLLLTACSGGGGQRPRSTSAETASPAPGTSAASSEPPVVWVAGELQKVLPQTVVLQGDGGQAVHLQRLSEGATRFYSLDGTRWRRLLPGEVAGIEAGAKACAQALLDGRALVALRVYVGSGCGPR